VENRRLFAGHVILLFRGTLRINKRIKNLPKKPNQPTSLQESLNEGSGSVMAVDFAVDLIDLLSTSNFVLI